VMNISRAQWLVLREVSKSEEGLIAFTLHRRLSVTAGQLASIVNDLIKRGYVVLQSKDSRVILTEKGMKIMQSFSIKQGNGLPGERRVDWIHRPQTVVNSPYVPRMSLK